MPRWWIALALAAGIALAGGGTAAAEGPTLIAASPGLRGFPRTDGTYVVWAPSPSPGTGGDVRGAYVAGARVDDRRVFRITGKPDCQGWPDIDGGVVIWKESRAVCADPAQAEGPQLTWGQDLAGGAPFLITDERYIDVRIVRPWVTWTSRASGSPLLQLFDLRTRASTRVVLPSGTPLSTGAFIDSERIMWSDVEPPSSSRWRLHIYDLRQRSVTDLTFNFGPPTFYQAAGNALVLSYTPHYGRDWPSLTVVDLPTGVSRFGIQNARNFTLDGRYLFFERRTAVQQVDVQQRLALWAYDLLTDNTFVVAAEIGWDGGWPHTRGGAVTWVELHEQGYEIHAARVADVLPSAPRADGGQDTPERRYFPQTGHALAFGFKGFWEQNGGLPIFGYPLTEEFGQRKDEMGNTWTVQYTERQRFEYHPELTRTPYEVQLGLLGIDDARGRSLLGTGPFRPAIPATPPDCIFFAETQHNLCAPFRDYWDSHGLEFGDPGTSYREALALFGLPISEAFPDPTTGRTTQFFERARFEYHPDNPASSRVLLGRVGAGLVTGWGWLPPGS